MWLLLIAATNATRTTTRPRPSGGSSSGETEMSIMEIIIILPGLVGLAAWLVGLVGSAISIAGPARARGMAITSTAIAAIHLILVSVAFYYFYDESGALDFPGSTGMGSPAWMVVSSTLPALDAFLPLLFYLRRALEETNYIILLVAAIFEVLRLIFMQLSLKSTAVAARDHHAAGKSQFSLMATSFVIGGVLLFVLLMVVLLLEGKFRSPETYGHLGCLTILLTYAAYAAMMFLPAMAALATKRACDNRS
jgi:hypothetical protein